MNSRLLLSLAAVFLLRIWAWADEAPARFDAAPFARPLPDAAGLIWDDPREIHEVTAEFAEAIPANVGLRLEYWGSRWPQQHLPKDREPGGGEVGWQELGNWYNGGWRVADTEMVITGKTVRFTFHPVNAREFPGLKDYTSTGRFTLKVRVTARQTLPRVAQLHAFTDSVLVDLHCRLVWSNAPVGQLTVEAFNGSVSATPSVDGHSTRLEVQAVKNPDPNTFDRTLITIHDGTNAFSFKVDDLDAGPLFLPEFGVAVLPEKDPRDYATVANDTLRVGAKTLYDRVAELPEQTWSSAWDGLPPKKSRICFVLGLDGSRQKFRLDANGDLSLRANDQYLQKLPGRDTRRIQLEKAPLSLRFGLPDEPAERHLEEEALPICVTTWRQDQVRIVQSAFATTLAGTQSKTVAPEPDAFAVALVRFEFTNLGQSAQSTALPITFQGGETYAHLRVDDQGLIWNGTQLRGQVLGGAPPVVAGHKLDFKITLSPGESRTILIKLPYVPLIESAETAALTALDFSRERQAIGDYWRRNLDHGSQLSTPEPVLNQFYRALPSHLLINSEFEPGNRRRFPRVGSFNYGNYANESCMMVLDLDRRGYHEAAEQCLDAWLHYQSTVGLPGDFKSKEGVLYGTAGYESGGYNQHHGWVLWTLSEHYRFTRNDDWLKRVTPGILAGAEWIIRETDRTESNPGLDRGLLPAGDLEDIGDWWTWLSTSCYTWRGLEGAAWALEQAHHPEAARIRAAADKYHQHLVGQFHEASQRSPVVRLRDGVAVPQIPSYVQRRGRSFGWICETLEGAIHLIITRAIDPGSLEAQWILKDYEDNLFLSNQYGYTLPDFESQWFGRGGMSMQACLLLDVEAYLYRDDVKHALRSLFNALAVSHFPDVHMNTEHALPEMGDWRGDHFKTSDEANASGWLRQLFVREEGDSLRLGQAIPRDWLKPGQQCGLDKAATYFGQTSIQYRAHGNRIRADLRGPTRNPPGEIRVRFRAPGGGDPKVVFVNDKPWRKMEGDWAVLPGNIGNAKIEAVY